MAKINDLESALFSLDAKGWAAYECEDSDTLADMVPKGPAVSLSEGKTYIVLPKIEDNSSPEAMREALLKQDDLGNLPMITYYPDFDIPFAIFRVGEDHMEFTIDSQKISYSLFNKFASAISMSYTQAEDEPGAWDSRLFRVSDSLDQSKMISIYVSLHETLHKEHVSAQRLLDSLARFDKGAKSNHAFERGVDFDSRFIYRKGDYYIASAYVTQIKDSPAFVNLNVRGPDPFICRELHKEMLGALNGIGDYKSTPADEALAEDKINGMIIGYITDIKAKGVQFMNNGKMFM